MDRRLAAGLLVGATLVPFGSTSIAVALPAIAAHLRVGTGRIDLWLVGGYLLVCLVGQGAGGVLADRLGAERAAAGGLVVSGCGAALGAMGDGLGTIAAGRILMAAGGAATLPAAMSLLRTRTDPARRVRAFGGFGAALGIAAAAGPAAGAALVPAFGWRSVFAACVAPAAVALVLIGPAALGAKARPAALEKRRGRAADAFIRTPGEPTSRAERRERRTKEEEGRPARAAAGFAGSIAGRGPFAAGSAVVGLHNLVCYGLLVHLPAALARSGLANGASAGGALAGMFAGMVAGSPVGGRLAEKLGARRTVLLGTALGLAGLALMPALASGVLTGAARAGLVLVGSGLGLAMAPAQSAALGAVAAERAGAASGVLSTVRYLGGLAAVAHAGDGAGPLAWLALGASALAALALPGRTDPGMTAASETRGDGAPARLAPRVSVSRASARALA